MNKFSSSEAKRLVARHQDLLEKLDEISNLESEWKKACEKVIKHYVAAEVMKLMRDISVDELNRDKRGIRIKALKDSGFSTYADIMSASTYELACVKGVSDEKAYEIKKIVYDASDAISESTRLRLNADQKTPESTRVVVAITKMHQSKALANECAAFNDEYRYKIEKSMDDVLASAGTFKWLFSPSAKKQRAVEAFDYLEKQLEGDYDEQLISLFKKAREIESISADEAWDAFEAQPIQYTNTIEEIAPGLLGNGDAVYGLPEELAREVQDEGLFPDGLLCDLRRYQEWGVKYILHQKKVLLGDEMGLGKTIQAIATMVSLKNTGETHFVVVCPASVIINWCREITKFSRLRVVKVHGQGRQAALRDWLKNGGVAVTTYETTGSFELPWNFKYSLLVVDEAHYIKNPGAKRTKNTIALSQQADRLLFMTGTALENKVDEMVNLIKILQPSIAAQIAEMQQISTAPQFREKIAPVYYRRKREDVLTELPDLVENQEWCRLNRYEKTAYEDAILGKSYSGSRRVSWNVDDLSKSGKAQRMLELIAEAKDENRKVIVFSYYLDTIRKVCSLLGDQCTGPINGSVSPAKRQMLIDEFDNAEVGQVLAAQIMAGGTGLNIQSASVVIICEPQLKPSTENQAISRAYRMGQARNVLVYRLLCERTVDEKITDMLEEKQAIFDAFADKSVATEALEIDSETLGNIIQEEIDRINKERGETAE